MIHVLAAVGCDRDVIDHCLKVQETALKIADKVGLAVDLELISQGALLHDIGRSKTHGIEHALAGVNIARKFGFSGPILHIIERHIGAGITAAEAERLGLPEKDYLPLTPEEKIVSYADNLTGGVREMPFSEALDRFKSILGPDHEGVELFRKQHHEIQGWMK